MKVPITNIPTLLTNIPTLSGAAIGLTTGLLIKKGLIVFALLTFIGGAIGYTASVFLLQHELNKTTKK